MAMQENSYLGYSPLGFHQLAYTEWGSDRKQPPVICVHGLTRNGRDFDRLAASLQEQRRVICPDIVGRGRSDFLADASLYGYPQYLGDTTALIARAGTAQIDWVGTSMGGIIGMLLAASAHSPIRRLVINDVGPFIPLAALQRIASYVGALPEFASVVALEQHLRLIYDGFGITADTDWQQLAMHSARQLPNGKLTLAHDPGIAKNFAALNADVDFWALYNKITCPVLLLRGERSDILPKDVAEQMTQRGPQAKLIEFADVGHAPALMSREQIACIMKFLAA